MRVANRFSIAVHILLLMAESAERSATSEWMAGSIGVNAVIVRNVTGLLRRAGLVATQQGAAGGRVAKPLDQITMLEVFRAVEPADELFSVHANPNPKCPVGSRIDSTLRTVYGRAQSAMLDELAKTTLAQVAGEIKC